MAEKVVRAVILGAGYRGRAYAAYAQAHPEQLQIVGVADPVQAHCIDAPRYWQDWQACLNDHPDAEVVMVTLPDELHYEAALAAIKAGYHLLLEKPIAQTYAQCCEVMTRANAKGCLVLVGHILRYTPYFAHIKAIIDSGEIGEVVSIDHQELASYWKFAHSYCRGSWAKSETSTPIILAKCSHDFDLFAWWLSGRTCEKLTSFGTRPYFRKENQPRGAAARCCDCPASIERTCAWSARRMYEASDRLHYLFADSSPEAMARVVRESDYGRCVFCCDNDVPDHQTVSMLFAGGVTVQHEMTGFSAQNVRRTHISATRGVIDGNGETLNVTRFDGGDLKTGIPASVRIANHSRHGGGDFNLVSELIRQVRANCRAAIIALNNEALESHRLAFAAESSRLAGGKLIDLNTFSA